jgi:hypothetical protein
MPEKIDITDSLVFTVHAWFQDEMHSVGRKISFPKCSDRTKTYQFRWTKKFVDKCYNEFNLSDKVIKVLLCDIAHYAKRRNLLSKGTQLLCMNNVIDICHHSIQTIIDNEASLIMEVRSCHEFVCDQVNNKNILVRTLTTPISEGGYSKLVYWYNLGRLTDTYLALSKTCNKAMSQISADERSELPSKIELLRICTYAVSRESLHDLKSVLGSDLRVPPTIIK